MRLRWLWVVLGITVTGVSLWSVLLFLTNQSFREGALSNFLATMVGVIVGIPIALWISQQQQAEQNAQETANKRLDRQKRQHRILSLIKIELEGTLETLRRRDTGMTIPENYTQFPGVKNDLWNALSDGGELQWLDDVELLDTLSDAYYYIRWIARLEINVFDPHFKDHVVSTGREKPVEHKIRGSDTLNNLHSVTPTAIHKLEKAIREIERVLPSESAD